MKFNDIILINKPINITSNKLIQIIKFKLKIKKIGHCGTLDPNASGLLIICINNKTKLATKLIAYKKTYITTIIIGINSLSYDLDNKILFYEKQNKKINLNKITLILNKIKKSGMQRPQLISSLKHNGMQIYKYARVDIKLRIKYRKIKIHQIKLIYKKYNLVKLKIECDSGVYIRSIIEDLSLFLKKPLCALNITRIKINDYSIIESLKFSDILKIKM